MNSKIRIRLDNIEVEYEGEQEFLGTELLSLVEKVLALAPRQPVLRMDGQNKVGPMPNGESSGEIGTLNTLAAKLKPDSGPDLILAAMYHLSKADGLPSASRQQVLDRMKSATGYYKTSYRSNLSNYLESLVKSDKIREAAVDTYVLNPSTAHELEKKVA